MKKELTPNLAACLLCLCVLWNAGTRPLSVAAADAETKTVFKAGPIMIQEPWARATPLGATVGAGYLTITNTGTTPDVLTGGSASVADRVEVHEMSETDGIMKMRHLADGLVVAPGETVALEPGGKHLMLMGLKHGLQAGAPFTATLEFKFAGAVTAEFSIAPIGAEGPEHSHH